MSAMSKTAIPSLFYIVYSTILSTCTLVVCGVLVLEQNAAFWKQVRSSILLGILKQIDSHMHKDSSSVVYSHQQEARTLFSKGALNSNKLQRFNNRSGLKLSKWIDKNGVLLVTNFLKGLNGCHAEIEYKTELLKMAVAPLKNLFKVLESLKPMISEPFLQQMPLEMRFAKDQQKTLTLVMKVTLISIEVQKFNNCYGLELSKWIGENGVLPATVSKVIQKRRAETRYETGPLMMIVEPLKNLFEALEYPKPAISGPFFLRMTPEKKRYAEDLEGCHKSPEKPVSTTRVKTESLTLKSYQQDDGMKLRGMCFLCQEMISKKKFFDERRFGILRQCNCMICYGCIRKVTCTSGVVKGPVMCPCCSVESDIVAASARWIKGEEKLKFFERFIARTQVFPMMMDRLLY